MRRHEGKRPLGRPKRRWELNIKIDFKEMGYDSNWIDPPDVRINDGHIEMVIGGRVYIRMVMNLQ